MGVFTDIFCAECEEKTKMFLRTKLLDGTYVCSKCTKFVPPYMRESFYSSYDLDDFRALRRYAEFSNMVLRPMFHETHKYYSIHVDAEHKIFFIGDRINDETLFLRFEQLDEFDLVYHADEYKEGMASDKVYGRILLKIKMDYPYFYHEEKLDEHVKAKAKKALFGTQVEYENPKGMDEFSLHFLTVWENSLEDIIDPDDSDGEDSDENTGCLQSNELSQAMALFMIDDLSSVTLSELKEQRNRLIKTFHPDKATANGTKYAQKINGAYEILKKQIE